jgi:hypothetical protein
MIAALSLLALAFLLSPQWLLFAPVWVPLLLLTLYAVGIQYERGGNWRVLVPLAYDAAALDILLNYTLFALYFLDRPRHGEITLSQRLPRLNLLAGWQGTVARALTVVLDRLDPSGQHVKRPAAS